MTLWDNWDDWDDWDKIKSLLLCGPLRGSNIPT